MFLFGFNTPFPRRPSEFHLSKHDDLTSDMFDKTQQRYDASNQIQSEKVNTSHDERRNGTVEICVSSTPMFGST